MRRISYLCCLSSRWNWMIRRVGRWIVSQKVCQQNQPTVDSHCDVVYMSTHLLLVVAPSERPGMLQHPRIWVSSFLQCRPIDMHIRSRHGNPRQMKQLYTSVHLHVHQTPTDRFRRRLFITHSRLRSLGRQGRDGGAMRKQLDDGHPWQSQPGDTANHDKRHPRS